MTYRPIETVMPTKNGNRQSVKTGFRRHGEVGRTMSHRFGRSAYIYENIVLPGAGIGADRIDPVFGSVMNSVLLSGPP
jgi:hypothetical protein